jgi:hypothetical protein
MADEHDHTPRDDSTTPDTADTADTGTAASPPAPVNPNEALDLLGDLEARLGQLRQWQNENDRHAEEVKTQTEEMARREQELQDQQIQLADDRQAVEAERQAIEQQVEEVAQQRQALEERDAEVAAGEQKLAESWNGYQSDRDALDRRLIELEEQSEQLTRRSQELDERQAELDRQQESLTEQQARVEQQWCEIESARQELAEAEQQVQSTREAVEADRATLAADQTDFNAQQAEFAEQRQALKDRKQDLAKAQMDLRLRQDSLQAQEESLARARAELSEQAASPSSSDTLMPGFIPDFEQAEKAAEAKPGASKAELEILEKREAELEAAEAKLTEKKQAFRERVEQSKEKLLAERERVQADEQAVHELNEQLEQQQAELDHRQQELDARAAELTGQRDDLEEQRREIEARGAEVDQLRAEAEAKAAELEDLRNQFDDGSDSAETVMGVAAIDPVDFELPDEPARPADWEQDHQKAVAELEEKQFALDAERVELDQRAHELQELAGRLDERQRDLEEREADLLQRTEANAGAIGDAASDSEKDRRICELTEELAEVQARHEQRKAKMHKADEVLRQRRDKVRGYLQQLREHSKQIQAAESQVESSSAQFAGLDRERRNLVEVKKFLESSEKQMVQRWATRSTAGMVALILLALMAAAAFSYTVGQKLVVPSWQATMTMSFTPTTAAAPASDAAAAAYLAETAGEPGGSAPATPGVDWEADLRQMIGSAPVLNEALDQMEQHGVRKFTTAEQLSTHLEQSLTLSGSAEQVQLTYLTDDGEHVERILQSVGRAVVARQMALDRAQGRPDSASITVAARASEVTSQEDSLIYMGIAFGSILTLALVLGLVIRLVLARSKRVMEEPEAEALLSTLDKPTTWSPLGSAPEAE